MADLEISVEINASGTQKGAAAARRDIKSVADEGTNMASKLQAAGSMMQQFGGQLQSIGTTLSVAVTAPIVAAGAAILKAGSEYETALNIFGAVTHATANEMEHAQQVAKALGADLDLPATSAKDAALAMNELGKAGLTAAQAMDAAKGVLQLAAAGQLDGARAAEIAANALNAFKLEAKDTTRVADLLAAAANASSSSVDEIALSMQQASAVFASAKIPIEDMTTAIGIMANAGIKGSDAGTSLKQFMLSLQAPTSKAAETMKDLGVQVYDASGNMKPLITVIGDFQHALSGLNQEQQNSALAKIFGSDAIRAAQILFGTGEEGFKKMKEQVTAVGAAADLAMAVMKGLGGAWMQFKSQLETIGITVYESIKQPLTDVLQGTAAFVGQMGTAFSQLSPAVQQVIVVFAGLAAAIGPVLFILGSIISTIGGAVAAIGTLGTALAGLTAAGTVMAGLGAVLSAALPIVLALIAGIAQLAVVAGVVYAAWQTNFGGIRELTATVAAAVQEAWNAALAAIRDLTESVMAEVKRFWDENGQQITEAVQLISDQIKQVWTAVVAFWRDNNEEIKAIASAVWEAIKSIVTTIVRVIADAITIFLKAMKGDWAGAWNATQDLLQTVMNNWESILRAGVQAALALTKLLFAGIWALGQWVFDESIKLGLNLVQGIANGIRNSAHLAIEAAKNLAASLPDWVRQVLHIASPSKVMHQIGQFIAQGLANGILSDSDRAVGAADSIGKRILRSFRNMLGQLGQLFGVGGFGSGGGMGGTPPFAGGGSASGGGLGGILGQIFGGNGGPRNGSTTYDSEGNPTFNVNPGNMGIWGNLKNIFSTKDGGIFAPRENILTGKTSKLGGIMGGAGAIASMLGGMIGGRFGSVLGSIGTYTQLGAMFGPIGAGVGAVVGLIAGLFGINSARRKDEQTRNQGMLNAFDQLKQFDAIIADVRGLRLDPMQGIAQGTALGDQVRSSYLQMASSLKDKKTRNIALADVSRIDGIITQKMAELRAVADVATAAGERQRRMLPEFANGVYMSPAFTAFRQYNGMLGGRFTGRDVIPAMLAHGEMVLNPRQQAQVRANAGSDVFQNAGIPGYAGGGVAQVSTVEAAPTTLVFNFEHSIDAQGMVQTVLKDSTAVQKQVRVVITDGFANGEVKTTKRGA
jgi:TP901 family phage tail tape measure protein